MEQENDYTGFFSRAPGIGTVWQHCKNKGSPHPGYVVLDVIMNKTTDTLVVLYKLNPDKNTLPFQLQERFVRDLSEWNEKFSLKCGYVFEQVGPITPTIITPSNE